LSEKSTIDEFVVVVDWEDVVQVTDEPFTKDAIDKNRSHRSNSGVAIHVDTEVLVVSEDLDHAMNGTGGYHIIPRGAVKEVRHRGKKVNWNQVRAIANRFRKSRKI
jgi:hypothetical protein